MTDVFRIAFLCTANRARSAFAEECARLAAEGLPVELSSAGLLDMPGHPVLDESLVAANELGVDLSGHRSRRLTEVDLRDSDLVIGFELSHVAAAVVEGRVPAAKVFTLKEFVRLSGETNVALTPGTPGFARARVQEAHRRRSSQKGFVLGTEIPDPAGGKPAIFHVTFEEIKALVDEMFVELFR